MACRYRFGLLGHPVGHSLSPVMHAASFRSLGLDAEYRCFDVPPESLGRQLAACRDEGFDGLNLTVPHKEAAVPLMDQLDSSASLYGAVNTVRVSAKGLTGFNTDAEGFLADLAITFRMTLAGRRVLVLGCGGAGRALAIACVREGASELFLANRTQEKARRLGKEIADRLPEAGTRVDVLPSDEGAWAEQCRRAELVVQCTTSGLRAQDAPVLPADAFRAGQLLYDIVYTVRETPTMREARRAGAETVNGAGMLVHQGASAFTVWTGMTADTAAMRAALETRIYGA